MLRVQRLYKRSGDKSARTGVRINVGNNQIGFAPGEEINVYCREDLLFYSFDSNLPEKYGFTWLTKRKTYIFNRDDLQSSVPAKWLKEYCSGLTHVKVFYTHIGLFIKPYYGMGKEDK